MAIEEPQPGFLVLWGEDDKLPETILRVTWRRADPDKPESCDLMVHCYGAPEPISGWVAEIDWASDTGVIVGCTKCVFSKSDEARYVRQDEAPFWMLALLERPDAG